MYLQQMHIENKSLRCWKHIYLGGGCSTLWDNTDGCAEHYIYATALYLLSILLQYYNIIIDRVISALGHDRDIVYVSNAT